MPGSDSLRLSHRSRVGVVVLYAFVVAASAFLHHDVVGRPESRTHCIACTVTQHAQKVDSHSGPLDVLDRVSGRVEVPLASPLAISVDATISDRAPPA
jgi:hypothetical protein